MPTEFSHMYQKINNIDFTSYELTLLEKAFLVEVWAVFLYPYVGYKPEKKKKTSIFPKEATEPQ